MDEFSSLHGYKNLSFDDAEKKLFDFLSSEGFTFEKTSKTLGLRQFNVDAWASAVLRYTHECPDDWKGWLILARHYGRSKEFDKAIDSLRKVLKLNKKAPGDLSREILRYELLKPQGYSSIDSVWGGVENVFRNELSSVSYKSQHEVVNGGNMSSSSSFYLQVFFDYYVERALTCHCGKGCESFKELYRHLQKFNSIAIIGKGSSGGEINNIYDCFIRVNHDPVFEGGERGEDDVFIYAKHLESRVENVGNIVKYRIDPVEKYRSISYFDDVPCADIPSYLAESISYRRATTGLRLLILITFMLPDLNIDAYGFDFYSGGDEKDKDNVRNSAGMAHEIDYEYWFTRNFLDGINGMKFR